MSEETWRALAIGLMTASATLLGVFFNDWLAQRRTEREVNRQRRQEADERVMRRRVEKIRATEPLLVGTLEQALALVPGDVERLARAQALVEAGRDGDIRLLGDVELIREYQDLLAELSGRVGERLTVNEQKRASTLMARIGGALAGQEERALRFEPLLDVPPDVAPELFDPDRLAERLKPYDIAPSIPGLMARIVIAIRRRLPL